MLWTKWRLVMPRRGQPAGRLPELVVRCICQCWWIAGFGGDEEKYRLYQQAAGVLFLRFWVFFFRGKKTHELITWSQVFRQLYELFFFKKLIRNLSFASIFLGCWNTKCFSMSQKFQIFGEDLVWVKHELILRHSVELVRLDLTKLQRVLMGALIVLDVGHLSLPVRLYYGIWNGRFRKICRSFETNSQGVVWFFLISYHILTYARLPGAWYLCLRADWSCQMQAGVLQYLWAFFCGATFPSKSKLADFDTSLFSGVSNGQVREWLWLEQTASLLLGHGRCRGLAVGAGRCRLSMDLKDCSETMSLENSITHYILTAVFLWKESILNRTWY